MLLEFLRGFWQLYPRSDQVAMAPDNDEASLKGFWYGTGNAYVPRFYWGNSSPHFKWSTFVCVVGRGVPFPCFQIEKKLCPFVLNEDNSCSELSHWAWFFCPVGGQVSYRWRSSVLSTPVLHTYSWCQLLWYRVGLDSPSMSDMHYIGCFSLKSSAEQLYHPHILKSARPLITVMVLI